MLGTIPSYYFHIKGASIKDLIISIAMASTITAITALRFRKESDVKFLSVYFLFFALAEWVSKKVLLPPNALGYEIAYVCFFVTFLFIATILAVRFLEASQNKSP